MMQVVVSSSGLLLRTNRMVHRVHHMQLGADDMNGLLIAALTATAHATRPWQRAKPAAACCPCHAMT